MKYAVVISAGHPTDYSPKQGWDNICESRAEADALAERARKNAGWSAKVITLTETEAAKWHQTLNERLAGDSLAARLAGEKRAFDAALRAALRAGK